MSETLHRALAAAEIHFEKTQAAAAAATEGERLATTRLAALETERAAIRDRRAIGDARDDDGSRVALLELDRQGLATLLDNSKAEVDRARQDVTVASTALDAARRAVSEGEAWDAVHALFANAADLVSRLRETQSRMAEAACGLPPLQRLLHARSLVDLGQQLEAAMAHTISGARQQCNASGTSYPDRPKWRLSDEFVREIRKLEYGDGRLV